MKKYENMYMQARKNAAEWNERLSSREKAAELLGLHESSLADYELDNVKVVPVDRVNAMADLYKCPELKAKYCKHVCPLGQDLPIADEASSFESTVIRILKEFDDERVYLLKKDLVDIAVDGKVSDDEVELFGRIIDSMDSMIRVISELKLISEKEMKK